MKIDPKDLITLPMPIQIGGHFFLKMENGDFQRCVITEWELQNPERAQYLRIQTMTYHSQGRLFVRRDKPWSNFNL